MSAETAGWNRLWGIAVLFHTLGNGANAEVTDSPWAARVSLLLVGLVALVVIAAPTRRAPGVALCLGVLVTAWLEAPFLPNHWLLASLVAVLALTALTVDDPWPRLRSGSFWLLVAFYSWAAVSKLNTSFLDPTVSCARAHVDQALGAVGLPHLPTGGAVPATVVLLVVGIELAVVPLLLVRRTRRIGLGVAAIFHYVVTFDLGQHFFDFTAVLFVLFSSVCADETLRRIGKWTPGDRLGALGPGVLVGLVVLATTEPSAGAAGIARIVAFGVWFPIGFAIVRCLLGRDRSAVVHSVPRPTPGAVVVAGIAFVIGMFPYVGIRNATAWNMYSNLAVGATDANHLFIPTLRPPLDDEDLVQIAGTDHPLLEHYLDPDIRVPWINVAHWLTAHPDEVVEIRWGGADVEARSASDVEDPPGIAERKLLFSRAVLSDDRCPMRFGVLG